MTDDQSGFDLDGPLINQHHALELAIGGEHAAATGVFCGSGGRRQAASSCVESPRATM